MSLLHSVPEEPQPDVDDPRSDSPRLRGRGGSAKPSGQHDGSGGGSLTRVTANFTPRAMAALERVAAQTGDSKTDVLNRAVTVYEVFLELMERSDGTLHLRYPDGAEERLRLVG
jgi:hypothetical protein